jgi:uroporphyrinogen decarboxylase
VPKETMSPRERWLAVLRRQKPDRIPMDFWGTDETVSALMKHLGCASKREALEKLRVDFVVKTAPRYVGPALKPGLDPFGRAYRQIRYDSGVYDECVNDPLAAYGSVDEIERNYVWPNPDWWDYKNLPAQLAGVEMYPVQGGGSEPFLIYKDLRGQEQALVDLIENPDIVRYGLGKLFSLAYEDTRRTFEALPPGRVTFAYVAEDMGAQTDLLFSVPHIREFLLPGMKRIIDLSHQGGAFVFHHNDGAIRRIIPDMIEAGIDLLNPIQWRCDGMDREGLKRDFGRTIVFHGGMDNQQTLPFGTVEEVGREVLENIRILGRDGGYILAPCHNIQALTPPENIVAMYRTCYENGWS